MPTVAISSDFLKAYSRIPKAQQKKVREFTEKFRLDPTQSSINYEPIHDMKDEKVRTVRIDLAWRAVVIHPPKGDVYLLVWVDHHDEAMDWAKHKKFEVNPTTGSLQVYEVEDGAAPAAVPVVSEAPRPERLFSALTDEDLLLLGVPSLLLPSVRSLRAEADLDQLHPYLPGEASDALYLVASGLSVEETLGELERSKAPPPTVDVEDFQEALKRPESQTRFKVIGSERELLEMLNAPLELWRVFLHPSQRKIVERSYNGPAQVLGGAGTGKTVVLLHRAHHLASKVFTAPGDRLLVTTFTRNLARDLRKNLEMLCGKELERIEVKNLHAWAEGFLRSQGVKHPRVDTDRLRSLWSEVVPDDAVFPVAFYREEWEQVVQAQDVTDREGYFKASRTGRGTPLNRKQRSEVWGVLDEYRSRVERENLLDWPDVFREVRLYLEAHPGVLPYRAVLVDEVQDLPDSALRLLRAMVPVSANDLFLVGDAHQRIYGHRTSLSASGIKVTGRSRRLKINYRTTGRICDWATALLKGLDIDDLDGGSDDLRGYHSLREGVLPEVRVFGSADGEAGFVVETLRGWLAEEPASSLCLSARTNSLLTDRYLPLLASAGIPAVVVDRDEDGDGKPGVRLASMHRMKGLEFTRVLLAGVNEGVVPLVVDDAGDEASRADHEKQEKCLLYVAATRARDYLVVTGFGRKSRWLDRGN